MSGALAFIAGLGGGYLQGQEREVQRKRQEAKDAQESQQFQWQAQDRARQEKERQTLQSAGQPIAMTEGAGGMVRPETMDNQDVGQPENDGQPNNGLMPVAFRVGAQPFANRNDAQADVAMQNSPSGVQGRRVAALEGMGRFDEADRARATQLQLAEATRRYQDEGYSDALKALRSGDAAGAVAAFNKSGSMKIAGDMQLSPKEIDLPGHGKINSYDASFNLVNPDGSVRPMKLNTHDATMASMPYEKVLKAGLDAAKEKREATTSEATANYHNAVADYYKTRESAPGKKSDVGKPFKMDEDDKLRFTEANKSVHEANKALNDAMGKLMPGDEPSKSPAIIHAQGLVKAAKLNQFKTGIQVGAVTPEQIASDVMGVAKNPADVMNSLKELANTVGTDFSDQVGVLIQGNDAWSRMNPTPRPAVQPPIAASIGAPLSGRPVTQAPANAQAPVSAQPSQGIASALGASDAGGSTIDQIMREKVPQFQAAAKRIEFAKSALAAAAKSQDPVALQRYAADVQKAREQLDSMLAGMNQSQANAIRKAIGTY